MVMIAVLGIIRMLYKRNQGYEMDKKIQNESDKIL